jgi:hypothetical protein
LKFKNNKRGFQMDQFFLKNQKKVTKEVYDHQIKNDQFYSVLQSNFPGSMPLPEYIKKTYEAVEKYGFNDPNTMGMISICRDEITDPVYAEVIATWGKTFNCCSLAGFITFGKTGLSAAKGHTPIENSIRRFVYYAMPHIAISEKGIIGEVMREGIENSTHACGALELIVNELKKGEIFLQTDPDDIEQSIVRQKILSNLKYGKIPDLVEITKLAKSIIQIDLDKLLNSLDSSIFYYSVFTGIEIHGPEETEWIYPSDSYVLNNGSKIELKILS